MMFCRWLKAINRDQFKVSMSTKVCRNNFVRGYRTSECPTPTFYTREYDRGCTKTSKTCSKDEIYRELVYEDVALLLDEVIVELDQFG